MTQHRDRAEGWQHAKLSGHKNEERVLRLFSNPDFCKTFSKRLNVAPIIGATIGGLNEKSVDGILGDSTKSKSDLSLTLQDNTYINISIKKSRGGQVYLIGVERFIEGFEKQFQVAIDDSIKNMMRLYFGGHPNMEEILKEINNKKEISEKIKRYQQRKQRLVWDSLCIYNKEGAYKLLSWFRDNIGDISTFCFGRGLAMKSEDWADYVWYTNLIGEDNIDKIFSIEEISKHSITSSNAIEIGKTLGGTTIQLPFGFVQWHQGKMQFHHSLDKIAKIVEQ